MDNLKGIRPQTLGFCRSMSWGLTCWERASTVGFLPLWKKRQSLTCPRSELIIPPLGLSQLIIPLLFFPLLIQERRAFFGCAEQGPLPSYSTWTQLGDFSCWGGWALGPVGLWSCSTQPSVLGAPGLESTGSVFVVHRLSFPEACGIFPSQGSNCVSRIGRWILYPRTSRKVPECPSQRSSHPTSPSLTILLWNRHFLVFWLHPLQCVGFSFPLPVFHLWFPASLNGCLFSGFQAWSRWQEQLLFVQRERWKTVSALTHLQRRQQWRALRAWLEYLQLRREKRLRNRESRAPGVEGGSPCPLPPGVAMNLRGVVTVTAQILKEKIEEDNKASWIHV